MTAGFVYIGCRLYYRITPRHPSLPEAMTRTKGDRIARSEGRDLHLQVYSTPRQHGFRPDDELPRYDPYAEAIVHLNRSQIYPSSPAERADGAFMFEFSVDDTEFLSLLCDRRDPVWSNRSAFEQLVVHWGTQNWGGLSIELTLDGEHLYRCEVDAFTPEDTDRLSGTLYVFAHSMDPEKCGKESPPSKPASPSAARPSTRGAKEHEAYSPKNDAIRVGKCLHCGSPLLLSQALLDIVVAQGGGYSIVPCMGCPHRAQVRILSTDESRRANFKTQVIQPHDTEPPPRS